MDLIQEIMEKSNSLNTAITSLKKRGKIYAEAEKDYKMALSKEVLKYRAEGQAVTLIPLVVYGLPDIAMLRLKRDIAKTNYESAKEYINLTKLQIRIIDNQISREF